MWERKLAVCLLVIVFLLMVRLAWVVYQERASEPIFGETPRSLYPVYFSTPTAEALVPEFREGQGSVAQRLSALVQGPLLAELSPVLPKGVRVLSYEQRGDLLYVDFSHHLISNHPGGSRGEMLSVYGIVNTLVGVAGIERVQILVEGEQVDTLVGHLNLWEPLRKDYELLGCISI